MNSRYRFARGLQLILVILFLASGICTGQLRLTGDASTAFVKSENGGSQYVVDNGRATFAWQFDLFGDAVIADNIFFLSTFRMVQDQVLHIDLLEIRLADIASTGLNADVGEIDIPFGNLADRRFPRSNPFFNLPITHEHLTSLRNSNYGLWPFDNRYVLNGDGMRLLDQGLYDLGVKVYGGVGIFYLSVAVMNGMISSTTEYSSNYSSVGLNRTGGFGKVVRLAATPATGLTIGASYAAGPFLRQTSSSTVTEYSTGDLIQKIVEGDVDFSTGYFSLYGEGFYNVWGLGSYLGTDLRAFGYSLEGKYAVTPRFSVAARVGGIAFNDVSLSIYQNGGLYQQFNGPWDRNVFRLEGAIGYRLDRDALVKAVYQWNRTYDVLADPHDNLLALQIVVNF